MDGFDIIVGIGEAQIDPVKTEPLAIAALEASAEFKAVDAIKQEMKTIAFQALQAKQNSKQAKNEADKNRFYTEFQARSLQMKDLEEKIKAPFQAMMKKKQDLIIEKAVYFQPAKGEEIVSADDAAAVEALMIEATAEGKLLDKNRKKIDDYRGKTFWKKVSGAWLKNEIYRLGESPAAGYVLDSKLSDQDIIEITDQINRERIANLKPAARQAEKEQIIAGLLARANAMRGELEIVGDPQALKKSQDWYKAEVAIIDSKYA